MAELNEQGFEILDDTPVAVPVRLTQPTMYEYVRKMIREQMSREAELHGQETFAESDDFEVGDDYDPRSPYEIDESVGMFEEQVPQKQPDPEPDQAVAGGAAQPQEGAAAP
jgi:hypothetical protein